MLAGSSQLRSRGAALLAGGSKEVRSRLSHVRRDFREQGAISIRTKRYWGCWTSCRRSMAVEGRTPDPVSSAPTSAIRGATWEAWEGTRTS